MSYRPFRRRSRPSLFCSPRILRYLCLIGGLFASANLFAATYYIDYASGNDGNSGTSKSSPWKRCPGMSGFSGSYSHTAGDRFIFKGGVTWGSDAFPMKIGAAGTSSARDYYGVDKSYFSGASWSRPIFNRGGVPTHTLITANNYVTIDNFDITGFYWDASTGGFGTCMILAGKYAGVTISNCYFHNWNHAAYSSGCKDDLQVILGSTSGPGPEGLIDNCVFDGSPNGTKSGMAVYSMATIKRSTAQNMTNGFLPFACNGSLEVSDCEVGKINWSFDPTVHPNSIEAVSDGIFNIHHNRIHDSTAVCIFVGTGSGNVANIYNNVIWNSSPIPIQFDGRTGSNNTAFVYNNTVIDSGGRNVIGNTTGVPFTVTARNNHVIGGSITPDSGNNLVQSMTAATAANFVLSNLWRPMSGSAPTVDAGTQVSMVTDDLLHNSRPKGNKYDIGAFEFTGVTAPGIPTPSPTATPAPTSTPTPPPTTPTPPPTTPLTSDSPFNSTVGDITLPFVKNADNTISQSVQTIDPSQGGRAVYNFTISEAGDYVLIARTNAPDTGRNSFFFNIDGEPTAPEMIWDVQTTSGFEQRFGSWRGTGTDAAPEVPTKAFTLTPGAHQLIIVGREGGAALNTIIVSKRPGPPGSGVRPAGP